MNRPTRSVLHVISFFVLLFLPNIASAETLTLTTYYPAPFGAYDQIRLVPRAAQVGACAHGTMYVNSTTGNLEFCSAAGTWGPAPGVWLQNGTNIYPATFATANVAIGTTTATGRLHIIDSPDNLLTVGNNTITSLEGVNVRYVTRLYPKPLGGLLESTAAYVRIDPTGVNNHLFGLYGEITSNQDDGEAGMIKAVSFGAGDAIYVSLRAFSGVALETATFVDGTKGIISTAQDPLVPKPNSTLFSGLWDQADVPLFGMLYLDQATGNAVTVRKRVGAADATTQIRVWENDLSRERFAVTNDGTTRLSSLIAGAGLALSSPPLVLRGSNSGANRDWQVQHIVSTIAPTSRLSFKNNLGTERMAILDDGTVGVRTVNVGAGKVLTDTDGTGTADWRFPAYAP